MPNPDKKPPLSTHGLSVVRPLPEIVSSMARDLEVMQSDLADVTLTLMAYESRIMRLKLILRSVLDSLGVPSLAFAPEDSHEQARQQAPVQEGALRSLQERRGCQGVEESHE